MKQKEYCEECEEELEDADLSGIFPFMLPGMAAQQDILAENGVIFLSGALTENKTNSVLKKLWTYHFKEDYTDSVNIIISSSPGGRADCMWAIIDTMSSIKNKVNTIAMGEIASASSFIFFAGNIRKISENTLCMIHNFSGASIGNYPELVANRKGHDMEYKLCIQHLIRNSKYKTEAAVKKHLLKDQDHWLTANELVKHGLADEVYKNKRRKK